MSSQPPARLPGWPFMTCGIAFVAVSGWSGQVSFLGIGLAFLGVGVAFLARRRREG